MKKIITLFILLIVLGFTIKNRVTIVKYANKLLGKREVVSIGEKNEYYRDYDFMFVQNTTNFSPTSKQDILNIYYTAINAGKDSFTFYCPDEYEDCITEVKTLADDQSTLSDINNYVHPFNGFNHIETEYDNLGRVTINIMKSYNQNDIELIKQRVEQLAPTLINNNLSAYDNILTVHNYIINTTKYDSERSDKNIMTRKSDIAYGPLFEGYAICGGYTDLMELFLEKMNLKSFKVSSNNHVWNAVELNGLWYHLDLTWDDPVTNTGENILQHDYFLINSQKIAAIGEEEHIFDRTKYLELKEV